MSTYKISIVITLFTLLSISSFSQVYRTKDQQYSVRIDEFKQSNKISLSVKLYKGQLFTPWLTKFWDDKSKSWCYGAKESKFKFYLWPVRNSDGLITQFDLSVFYYGNGYDKMYTEFLFNDTYYKSK